MTQGRVPGSAIEATTIAVSSQARPGWIDFAIERQRHGPFVGREDVLARLDQWLLPPGEAGWVVVTGGPGMGKSAVLSAWLARREAAGAEVPHHFVRRQVATGGTLVPILLTDCQLPLRLDLRVQLDCRDPQKRPDAFRRLRALVASDLPAAERSPTPKP